jgi:hypothetical protein
MRLKASLFAVVAACSSPTNNNATPDGNTAIDDASNGSGSADPEALVASPMFGFSESSTQAAHWPTASFGMQRFWDSPPLQWPSINTAAGVFDFSNLDADLALAYSKGTLEGMYTLARTPTWATSAPGDASCNYVTAVGGGNGQCDAPNDLMPDGSGTNAIWKAWITAIATHLNNAAYLQTHAHVRYWEIWNEPDTQPFFGGTIAQLARMTEDANCIITGRGVIHEKGDGTATACTATALDSTAKIVMASAHAKGVALVYGQNELYCTGSAMPYQLPCPKPPDAIAAAVDVINFHMKPGNEAGITPEAAMTEYVNNVKGILQPAELAKPLWDGEASYSKAGFTDAYTDEDMQASFMPRFFMLNWTLGVTGNAWYQQPTAASAADVSYQQTYTWMVGSKLTAPCAATGSIWSCTIDKAGTTYQIMWDESAACASGTCTTKSQAVDARWTKSQDMTTASTATAISNGDIMLGIKPVVLSY